MREQPTVEPTHARGTHSFVVWTSHGLHFVLIAILAVIALFREQPAELRDHSLGLANPTLEPTHAPAKYLSQIWTSHGLRFGLIAILGTAALLGYLVSYPRDAASSPVFWSPKENADYFLSQFIRDGFSYPLPHADILPEELVEALTIRDAAVRDGNIVPKEFFGTMLLTAGVGTVSTWLLLIIVPASYVAAAVALFLITRRLFGFPSALVTYALALVSAMFWMEAVNVISDSIYSLTFFLWGSYFFLRTMDRGRAIDIIAFSAFMGLAVAFRYTAVLVMPPFAIAFLMKSGSLRNFVLALVPGLLVIAPIPFFNQWVFGSPTATGHSLELGLIYRTVKPAGYDIWNIGPVQSLRFAQTYLANVSLMLPFYLSVPAIIYWMRRREASPTKTLAFVAASVFLIVLVFNAHRVSVGSSGFLLHASVLRLMLPGFALLLPFSGLAVVKAGETLADSAVRLAGSPANRHRFTALIIGVAVVLIAYQQFTFALTSPGGIRQRTEGIQDFARLRSEILAATEPDALILVRRLDKVLFPARQTAIVYLLARNQDEIDLGNSVIANYTPKPRVVGEALATFADAGLPTYVIDENILGATTQKAGAPGPSESVHSVLRERGYRPTQVAGVTSVDLYKIESPSAGTDLVARVRSWPRSVRPGATIRLRWRVQNQGSSPAPGFRDRIVLSDDKDIDASDRTLAEHETSEGISGGISSHQHEVEVTLPFLEPGTYYLGIVADSDNDVRESDELNNAYVQPLVIGSSDADLVVAALSVPSSARPGGEVAARWLAQNQGLDDAGGFLDLLVLSSDSIIDASDVKLDDHVTDGQIVSGGGSHFHEVTLALPSDLPPGTYYIGVIVDAGQGIAEKDEANNTANQVIVIR